MICDDCNSEKSDLIFLGGKGRCFECWDKYTKSQDYSMVSWEKYNKEKKAMTYLYKEIKDCEIKLHYSVEVLEHTQAGYPGHRIEYEIDEITLTNPSDEWFNEYDPLIKDKIEQDIKRRLKELDEYKAESLADEMENRCSSRIDIRKMR